LCTIGIRVGELFKEKRIFACRTGRYGRQKAGNAITGLYPANFSQIIHAVVGKITVNAVRMQVNEPGNDVTVAHIRICVTANVRTGVNNRTVIELDKTFFDSVFLNDFGFY
jgi:hypothetical protein